MNGRTLGLALTCALALVAARDAGAGAGDPPTVSEQAVLFSADGSAGDQFGLTLAIEGDTVVVGSPTHDDGGVDAGAAHVFVRSGSVWSEQAELLASDAVTGAWFGASVAVSGDTAAVGAFEDDDNGLGSGSAYVFTRSGTTWSQQAKLLPSDGLPLEQFGHLDLQGDTCAVGSPANAGGFGAVYVYERSGTAWAETDKLVAVAGVATDLLGFAVSIDGNTLVAGAPSGGNGTPESAHVFVRAGTVWTEQAELEPSDALPFDIQNFGIAVCLSGDAVAIGAPVGSNAGVYVFERSGTVWTEQVKLTSADAIAGAAFGRGVALQGGSLAVGLQGGAVGFDGSGSTWTWQADFAATGFPPPAGFGWSVALDGGTVVVGAPSAVSPVGGSGTAHPFLLPPVPSPYCTAKPSSAGCTAAIGTSHPYHPASGSGGYSVTAGAVHSFKNGLLLAGIAGPATIPFGGGTLCVSPPNKRGPILNSGGSGPNLCDGAFATEVNDGAVVPLGLDAGPGNSAWYQYWARDPGNGAGTLGTLLSDAIRLDFR